MIVAKKVQVEFQDGTIAHLDKIAGKLREKRNNYKLGIATVVSEFVESVIANQAEIIEQIVMSDNPSSSPGTEKEQIEEEQRPVYKRVRVKRPGKGGNPTRTQTQTDKESGTNPLR